MAKEQVSDTDQGVLPETLFETTDTRPYAVLEPEIHERGIDEGRRLQSSAIRAALLEAGIVPEPFLSRADELFSGHHVRFVRVASLAQSGFENLERPGLVGHCQTTGKRIVIFSGDRWSRQDGAPSDPIARLLFGMNAECAGHDHLII